MIRLLDIDIRWSGLASESSSHPVVAHPFHSPRPSSLSPIISELVLYFINWWYTLIVYLNLFVFTWNPCSILVAKIAMHYLAKQPDDSGQSFVNCIMNILLCKFRTIISHAQNRQKRNNEENWKFNPYYAIILQLSGM